MGLGILEDHKLPHVPGTVLAAQSEVTTGDLKHAATPPIVFKMIDHILFYDYKCGRRLDNFRFRSPETGAFLIAKVKELLYQAQDMNVNKPEFDTLMEKLMKNLSEHIEVEENDNLPALEKAIDKSESESMSKSFGRTKMFVPTQSHPSAPDKPPL